MATWQDIEKQLEDFISQRNELSSAVAQPNGTFTIGSVVYSRQQIEKANRDLTSNISKLEKVLSPLRSAQAELARAQEIAKSPITESPTGLSQADADAAVVSAQKKLNDLSAKNYSLAKIVDFGVARPGMARVGRTTSEAISKTQPKPAGEPKPGTPSGGGAGDRKGGDKKVPPVVLPSNWEAKFREMFPANAWLVDIDPAKYPDLRKVLQDAVINRAWETTEGQTRFSAQLDGTSFFKELKTNNIVRDIKAAVGDLGFDSVPFNAFLTTAMNMGYKGETLKQEAYKEAFRTDDNGVYVNPTAVERVKKSSRYLSIAKIGTEFFSQVSDKTIAGVLTGGMTEDDVVRQQRELAKTKYGHLSNLIDQGFSMADLAAQFQSRAATLLEVDPATIDMSQAKFETAYNFGEEGKKRMMTTGEWDRLLRTDKQFNWDQTENAKRAAQQLVNKIGKAFERVI